MLDTTPSTTRRSTLRVAARDVLRLFVGVALASLLIDTWCVGGLVAPLVVVSQSMAPTLRGPHAQWHCSGCGHSFDCDLESLASRDSLRCPDCGALVESNKASLISGDRVLVDRAVYAWRAPRRFEVVVAQNPDQPSTLCVKRVVGLPGESLRLAGGQLWSDGERIANLVPGAHYARGELSAQLGDDEYYLLGDNSDRSRDSRDWSAVPARSIVGRAMHWSLIDLTGRATP